MNSCEASPAARVSTPVGTPSFDSPRGLGAFASSRRQDTGCAGRWCRRENGEAIRQFPNEWRMADKDDLVESAKIHSPAQQAHVLLAIHSIQSSHRFVPQQRFVTNAFSLPHVVNGDAQQVDEKACYSVILSASEESRQFRINQLQRSFVACGSSG